MNEPWGLYAKRNKPGTQGKILYNLTCTVSKIVKLIETQSRLVVARDWGEGQVGSYF